jgi:anaerobic ribonucleoside-triphosphate reductase activating protein
MKINISRVHFPVTTLGPGQRLGIWLQGCSIRCAGCISADTWNFGAGEIEVATLVSDLAPWLAECDGITVSGGEPFDQKEALAKVLTEIRGVADNNVLVFSGYRLEALQPTLDLFTGLIDALVSDPFDPRSPRSLALRGSDNQRLSFLTSRGRELFAQYDRPTMPEERRLDAMFDADGVTWMAGIPRDDDFQQMEVEMANAGHRTLTSRSKWGHR